MGSGSSRLGSRPSRSHRPKRRSFLSSLLMCGGSSSHATIEIEDDPSELLVNSMKHSEIEVVGLRSPTKESALPSGARTGLMSLGTDTETGASSESSIVASEVSSFEDGLMSIETSNKGMSKSKELVPSHPLNSNYRSNDKASTSYEDQPFSDSVSANARSNVDVVNGDCAEVKYSSSSSSQELGVSPSIEISVQNQDSVSAPAVSESPITSQSQQDDTLGQSVPPGPGLVVSDREQDQIGGGMLHVDVVSILSSILSSSSNEISTREARRNSRRLFWDSFSRRNPRRRRDSPTFVFSTDDADGLGSHNRWLLNLSGDGSHDGVGRDSGYMGSRTHTMNERRRYSRSEVWERLHGGHGRGYPQTSICPSGLHPNGTCSCDSILTVEESGTRASISRIVMLPEALFEILDEIHRQPASLSFSVGSLPAPEAVVDSFPIKYHRDPDITPSADDAARCYICLSEYEESEKIRVLPCRHEFHMLCVDKWLKEIHGVCPLCRGDVSEGFTEASVSDSGALA